MKYSKILFIIVALFPTIVSGQFLFNDVTIESKIDMQSVQVMDAGPGVVVFDYDNDGWDDIFMPGGLNPDKLYHTKHDGTFEDVAPKSFIILSIQNSYP